MKFDGRHLFRDISCSVIGGHWTFPSRLDYEHHLMDIAIVNSADQVWDNPDLTIAIQNDWHKRGQNGCIFAQHAAGRTAEIGWDTLVLSGEFTDFNSDAVTKVEAAVESAISDPDNQVLSLLFPRVNGPHDLANLIWTLGHCTNICFSSAKAGSYYMIAMRTAISENLVGWWLGFSSAVDFPLTRQAPVTELVVRTKSKPEKMLEFLAQDRSIAHVADVPIRMTEDVAEKVYVQTKERTNAILGDRYRQTAARARVTFALNADTWEQRRNVSRTDATRFHETNDRAA